MLFFRLYGFYYLIKYDYLVKNPKIMTKIQMVKGWIFIIVSAMIIFFLLRREINKHIQAQTVLHESEEKNKFITCSYHRLAPSG